MRSDISDETITTCEAAKLLQVSTRTVQLWVENGTLEAWKTSGGHRRILCHSVNKIIQQRAETSQAANNKPLSILIIEDDLEQQNLLRLQIESWRINATISCANNGYEGLIQIGNLWPKIVILDLVIPDLNGFNLINALRYQVRLKYSQIIIITMLNEAEIRENGRIPSGITILHKNNYQEPLRSLLNKYQCNNKQTISSL